MQTIPIAGRFAVFSDVHGNLPALEAVLAHIAERGLATVLCLGDLVGYGPFPNEVAALMRARGISTLMGNYDQGVGFATGDCGCVYKTAAQRAEGAASLAWTDAVASDETRAYLRGLDDRFVLETPAGELLAVHGSPRRVNEYLFEDRPERAMARMAAEHPYRAILCGHTHLPYAREVERPGGGSTLFVNVGSAGRPKDGDWRACYAVVDPARLAGAEAGAAREGAPQTGAETGGRTGGAAGPASGAAPADDPARVPAVAPARVPAVELARVPYDFERLQRALATTPLITHFDGPTEDPR